MLFKVKSFQRGSLLQPPCSVAKILETALGSVTTLIVLTAAQAAVSAQSCLSSYQPGTHQQRVSAGLADGRVGPIKLVNNTDNALIVSLYHPDAPDRVFKYWYAEPGQGFLLSNDNYGSDWGLQIDEGPICFVGRVGSWDGHIFTTFPSRLFAVDATSSTALAADKSRIPTPQLTSIQRPETYENIATEQIKQGQPRSGLISLLRAADLYRVSGQSTAEQRVRDRIKQLRGVK